VKVDCLELLAKHRQNEAPWCNEQRGSGVLTPKRTLCYTTSNCEITKLATSVRAITRRRAARRCALKALGVRSGSAETASRHGPSPRTVVWRPHRSARASRALRAPLPLLNGLVRGMQISLPPSTRRDNLFVSLSILSTGHSVTPVTQGALSQMFTWLQVTRLLFRSNTLLYFYSS